MKTVMKRLAGMAAIAALALPTFAQAAGNPATSLSLSHSARAATDASGKSAIGKSTLINLAIFGVLIAVVLVATTTGGDDDSPDSP